MLVQLCVSCCRRQRNRTHRRRRRRIESQKRRWMLTQKANGKRICESKLSNETKSHW
ncbi:hypothetical protein M758_UG310300 [Ceratodon purpureus]|nr:hypothetical protein M758_UG310300 [Ceratodon purpureus]